MMREYWPNSGWFPYPQQPPTAPPTFVYRVSIPSFTPIQPRNENPPLELGGLTYRYFVCQFQFTESSSVPLLRPLVGPFDSFQECEAVKDKVISAGELIVVPLPTFIFR